MLYDFLLTNVINISEDIKSEIQTAWKVFCVGIIPEKCKQRYGKIYKCFRNWCDELCVGRFDEKIFLA